MRKDKLAPCHSVSTPESDNTKTPKAFFNYVQEKFNVRFTVDVAASKQNTLCKKFISKKENALVSQWKGIAWCNPPYSQAKDFVEHCCDNAGNGHGTTFMLMAARTDREWWVYSKFASHLIFIKGRLKFAGSKGGAPFPSVILVFKKNFSGTTKNIYLSPTPYERGFQRGKPK